MAIPKRADLISLICAVLVFGNCPVTALDQGNNFLEIPNDVNTYTYDLSTLHIIHPGRFTIVFTVIDHPDVMKLQLKVLDTLRTFCTRPDGKYAAPADVLTLGPPDLPVDSIEVKSSQTHVLGKTYPFKMASWSYPYKRLALHFQGDLHPRAGFLHCKQYSITEKQLYYEFRASIMNGSRSKELFDCKRGLNASFLHEDDDPAMALGMHPVRPNTLGFLHYMAVCERVMHEPPYMPE